MCKSPVFGRGRFEATRSSAERVEPPGSRETTLDSRVRRAHRLITLPTAWRKDFVSSIYIDIVHSAVVWYELQPKDM